MRRLQQGRVEEFRENHDPFYFLCWKIRLSVMLVGMKVCDACVFVFYNIFRVLNRSLGHEVPSTTQQQKLDET